MKYFICSILSIILLACSGKQVIQNPTQTSETKPEVDPNSSLKGNILYYSSLIKDDKNNYKLYLERSTLYKELSRKSGWLYYRKLAIADLEMASKLCKDKTIKYKLEYYFNEMNENYTEALKSLDKYLKTTPDDVNAMEEKEYVLLKLDDTLSANKVAAEIRQEKKRQLDLTEKHTGNRYPKTVKEAVEILIIRIDNDGKEAMKRKRKEDLINYHFSLGMYIRNQFGLWAGNSDLLRSCGSETMHPDDASMIIIEALWKELQGQTYEHAKEVD